MKILISSIGSRGDVQPILALAIELQSLGHDARLCVAPTFKEWVESFGIACFPIGPDLRKPASATPARVAVTLSEEQRRQLAAYAVRSQFPLLMEAARDCDLVLAGGALQFAARSVSEALKIPYIFVACCPAVIPSSHHPPPKIDTHHPQSLSAGENVALWKEDERNWDDLFLDTLNDERAKLGLDSIRSVYGHILTKSPWLAADPILAPAAAAKHIQIFQTGAWILEDQRPLPAPVEEFLASGPAPLYFGFGSMRGAEEASGILVASARALGMRSILSQGWGNLRPVDAGSDCLLVEDVAHQQLFPRVAAIIHHGGAGTTTSAAGAGVPQVILPHLYDQYYWAFRVQQLGVGAAGPPRDALNVDAIVSAIQKCAILETRERAHSLAQRVERHGVKIAAERLVSG